LKNISRWLNDRHQNPFRGDGGFKKATNYGKAQDADPHREFGDRAQTVADAVEKGVELYRDFMAHPDLRGLTTPPSEVFSSIEQPGEPVIHLDVPYLERELLGNIQNVGEGILGAILKPLSQYLIKKALQPTTLGASQARKTPLPPNVVFHDFQHLVCVKEWFTTQYENIARELLTKVHPSVGLPGFQFDDKKGLYVVGEFA
jgi:hypothetical protein